MQNQVQDGINHLFPLSKLAGPPLHFACLSAEHELYFIRLETDD
jgi:hypothetical protein